MQLNELTQLQQAEKNYWGETHKSRSPHWTKTRFKYRGKTMSAKEWAEELSIPYERIMQRFHRGLSVEEILSVDPIRPKNETLLTYNGKTQNLTKWSKEIGISVQSIQQRIKTGKPIEQILYPGNLSTARKQAKHFWRK